MILAIGPFTCALAQILQAITLGHINRGTEGTNMGLMMGGNSAIAAATTIRFLTPLRRSTSASPRPKVAAG